MSNNIDYLSLGSKKVDLGTKISLKKGSRVLVFHKAVQRYRDL